MTFSHFIRTPHLDERIDRANVVSMDWTPTLHFYGTLVTREPIVDAFAYGLVAADDETSEAEAEAGAIYDRETRAGA